MLNKFQKVAAPLSVLLLLLSGCAVSGEQTEVTVDESPAAVETAPELKTQHWCYAAADFIAGSPRAEEPWKAYVADKGIINTVMLSKHLDLALDIMSSQDESYHEDTVLDASDETAREALFDGIRFLQGQTEMPAETLQSLEEANSYCTDPSLGLPEQGLLDWATLMSYVAEAK